MIEDHFSNINYIKSIECIIPTTEITITIRTNGHQTQKLCYLYVEKMDFKGLIQLRLTEKCDQRRMYITTVDSTSFHELKQEQSLHVTFAGFIEHLVRLLQDVQTNKLELHIFQLPRNNLSPENITNTLYEENILYQLQFVEMRPFKNLVHLYLPSKLAPLNVVLFYMNSILEDMQKKIITREDEIERTQHELTAQIRRYEHLEGENVKLRENMQENTQMLKQKHAEEIQKLQMNLQQMSEQLQTNNEQQRSKILKLQSQLEQLDVENAKIIAEKNHEQKRVQTLNEELTNIKAHKNSLKVENEKLQMEISVMKNEERKIDMHLGDARKQILELQEKIKKFDKIKEDISVDLEVQKKITQTKAQALIIATNEISKANEIILKQSMELKKLKKTVELRTEVALQQEKAINEKENMLVLRNEEINHLRNILTELRKEIPKELESMRKFADGLEMKYTKQIKLLRKKLNIVDKENKLTTREEILKTKQLNI